MEHEDVRHNVLDNYKFYQRCLAKLSGVRAWDFCGKREETVGGRVDSFTSSSPCLFKDERGGYSINIRYVNYTIRGDGSYGFRHSDGKITTLQLFHRLDADFKIQETQWISGVQHPERRYQGVEDCKVLAHRGALRFLGTMEDGAGRVCVGTGSYDPTASSLSATALPSPFGRECEKNWCHFEDAKGDLRVVYDWSPLRIGRLEGDTLRLEEERETPAWFRHVRGSSHGCSVSSGGKDELWFLCHIVHYVTPRHYYHMIAVLDRDIFTVPVADIGSLRVQATWIAGEQVYCAA
jgi:hypothetical protein